MAAHLDEAGIAALPVQSYSGTVRSTLCTGDLLFCSGNYSVSRMIRQVTNSPWSHVGIVVVAKAIGRVLFLESVEDVGVRFAPLSKYLTSYENGQPYEGALVVARCSAITSKGMTDAQKVDRVVGFGADALTLPYDKKEIGEILARVVLGIGRRTAESGYICSELVAACFASAGITITASQGGFVTPEDVWRDGTIDVLARVQ